MATNNGNLIITGGSGKKILNKHYIVAEEHQNKWILLKPTFIRMLGSSFRNSLWKEFVILKIDRSNLKLAFC